jgi:putative SOS response-associated peptidase YedK
MCYSAQVYEDFKKYVREFGADIDIHQFVKLYVDRRDGMKIKIPKAMDANFGGTESSEIRKINGLIAEYSATQALKFEQELFKQTKRLNDVERKLQTKTTDTALKEKGIATRKISKARLDLEDLRRTSLKDRDSRIFPGGYAPVIVMDNGKRVVRPMRYHCRPAGKPAFYDTKYPGTYNARRDNLEGFWKGEFGYTHGIMVVSTFYENVEGEDGKNKVLQFTPRDSSDMLVACLWSHWTDPKGVEPDLLSFAAITDEPEPEVAAAGHDRTIINIKPEHIDTWLNPEGDLQRMYAIFDDKQHPYYEHRLEKAA